MEGQTTPQPTETSGRWAVELVGQEWDLAEIAPHFAGSIRVERGDDGWELTAGRFQEADEATEIRTLAGETLALINGVARLRLDRPDPLSLGKVRRYREDGTYDASVFVADAARGRASAWTPTVMVNGIVAASTSWEPDLELAARDLRVGAVLAFLAMDPTWHSLYAAFDTVAEDERTERLDGVKRWARVSQRSIRRFTNTANSFSAVGAQARHGPGSDAPPRPMAREEAEELVKHIVERWLDELKRVGA